MEETKLYAFKTDRNVLIIDFLKQEDEEATDYIVGNVTRLARSDDEGLSETILHLADHSWASLPLLYDLAYQIKKYNPDSQINWVKTFTYVETVRIGNKYVEENFKPSPDAPKFGFNIPGYIHISEVGDRALMLIDYMQNIDKAIVEETRFKVILELKDRSI